MWINALTKILMNDIIIHWYFFGKRTLQGELLCERYGMKS